MFGVSSVQPSWTPKQTRPSCQGTKRRHESDNTSATCMDGTGGECSRGDTNLKKARVSREMTSQDNYSDQEFIDEDEYEDEDEDDSDWEGDQKPVNVTKWFCTNCTKANLDDVNHCFMCEEHKESGILRHGCFASPFLQDPGLTEVESSFDEICRGVNSGTAPSSSSTAVGFDTRMLLHSEFEMKSHPHPERPDRLKAIVASLATAGIYPGRCFPIPAREITKEELRMVHTTEHVELVEHTSQLFRSYFTSDTYANEHSACAARLAAGLCADLASAIFSGHFKNGFALIRPPGHHAGVRHAMGFCLHNNAAVAASAAQAAGAKKVLIVDWDVHHGNGTQEIFEQNKSVLYISLHRHDAGQFYPGTGAADEIGTNGAEGYCVNVPWSRGRIGDNDYIFAFEDVVLPIASEFAPDFIIISAGFDAARGDPIGCCDVTPAGYSQMTQMLAGICGGRLLVILEGGYNLRSISSSATAVIKVLLGETSVSELPINKPSKAGLRTVLDVLKIQMNFWACLAPIHSILQVVWEAICTENKRSHVIKKWVRAPRSWKWGRKRLLFNLITGRVGIRSKRR